MRNQKLIQKGISLAVLCAGFALAEESSVKGIMSQLSRVSDTAPANPVAVAAESVGVEPVAVAVEPPAAVGTPMDVEAVVEESRAQYADGEFEQAETGFKAVLAAEPKNLIAALYLKQIGRIIHRTAEEEAMNRVDEHWKPGEEQRYYPLTEKALTRMGLLNVSEPVHVEAKFPFVNFPAGAEAVYRPSLKKLSVRNTFENHQRIKAVLAAFGQAEVTESGKQVKIESRFIEFSEGALEELGFEWSALDGADLPGDWELLGNQSLFADSLRSVPYSKTGDLGLGEVIDPASIGWGVNRLEDMFSDEAGTLAFSGTLGGDAIDLLIRALDQTSGADVLSAPSIVTLSGEKATITVGERHNYPTIYEEGVSSGTILHVQYEDFEEKILGVEMDVTPTITGDEINLKINPTITELAGWQQFQLASANTSYNYYQYRVGNQYEHEPVMAKLPVFKRREIETEISVANGSTIGMGGLISEKLEEFEDRVPVLGSIPLVGRLFRSEGQRRVKRNLMIFVTATKVEPNGRMVSTRTFN